jgi:response regulator of citrate/malate metabolism
MTPKEKAEDILDKCYEVEVESVYFGVNHYLAKKFALIVVDEIINNWINNFKKLKKDETIEIKHSLDEMMELSHSMKYWNEVKQEIEKL